MSPADAHPQAPDDDRDETTDEQLDRNTNELLQELRVAATGVQVLFAFLLVVPFNTGWKKTTSFERTDCRPGARARRPLGSGGWPGSLVPQR